MSEISIEVSRETATERLIAWREVAAWIDYVAMEWIADRPTAGYLHHVGQCVRDEGERKYAAAAGFEPAISTA